MKHNKWDKWFVFKTLYTQHSTQKKSSNSNFALSLSLQTNRWPVLTDNWFFLKWHFLLKPIISLLRFQLIANLGSISHLRLPNDLRNRKYSHLNFVFATKNILWFIFSIITKHIKQDSFSENKLFLRKYFSTKQSWE